MAVGSNNNLDSRRDPPSPATKAAEGLGVHTQAPANEAVLRGWMFRNPVTRRVEPDTRRCLKCGAVVFAPLPLTDAELNALINPLSTHLLLGEAPDAR